MKDDDTRDPETGARNDGDERVKSLDKTQREGLEQLSRRLTSMSNMVKRAAKAKASGKGDLEDLANDDDNDESLEEVLEAEFMYSNEMMFVKGLVCWTLFVFVWVGIWISQDERDVSTTLPEPTTVLRGYQQAGFVLAILLLLPSLFEMGFTWLILIGDGEEPTLTLIKKIASYNMIQYALRGLGLAVVAVVCSLPWLLTLTLLGLPCRLCKRRRRRSPRSAGAGAAASSAAASENENDQDRDDARWWSAFYRLFGLLPDALLTWSLFPLSYLIIVDDSGSSAMSVITDLVAVQIFASLDDIIVQMLLSPQEGLQSLFKLYASESKSLRRLRRSQSARDRGSAAGATSSEATTAAKRT